MLKWTPSKLSPHDEVAEHKSGAITMFFRIEKRGKRTYVLKVNSVFVDRYRTDIAAKEEAERIANG